MAAAALTAGALAALSLGLAPAAGAVTPQVATVDASCGIYGSGEATLTATQNGTAATMTLSSIEITTPVHVAADTIQSTLTLVKSGTSTGTTAFSGTRNPEMQAGSGVQVGPLDGTVAPGDVLEAGGGSLKMVIAGITVTCSLTGPQQPGPFVYEAAR
ncbi:hypothetical protein [Streptomyces sp. VRA16 Mangrove soil]|uniref:hypothetical protein n=1 Tax=Streptomyces sp. VRA16 Mangrove soil TaxID=2817434 RepID=UPI001A9F50B3|nr:hypothetical protein [Streptomyces sp. VRA16 Mangrove soil]MBO1336951.1 hypothetical protein [Streptomyces sp. VRA16 Mangrove soil]